MRRATIALVAIALVGARGVGTSAAATPAAKATIAVDPSTGLVSGQSVRVSGTGFAADESLASAECKNGAVALDDCDVTTAVFPSSGDTGAYQFSLVVHSELITNNGPVDCTATAHACMIGVADGLDITGTAVTAPISFAPVAPPQAGVLQVPSAPVGADNGAVVDGTGFAPFAVIGVAVCATAPVDTSKCGPAMNVRADDTGAIESFLNTPEQLLLQSGDTIDCTVAGTCVFATWDERDFASTLTTAAMSVLPEVAGTMTVTPHTGLHDDESVTVSGRGWPAEDYLSLSECSGTGADAVCDNYDDVQVADDGTFSTPFSVTSQSSTGLPSDCAVDSCSIVVTWYAFHGAVDATRPIAFDATPDAETSNYTADELTAVQGAAATLGMTTAQLQRNASWALAFVLAITRTRTITPVPNTGPSSIETNWDPGEHAQMTGIAASEGATLPGFQKTGALFVAYVLALSQSGSR